MTVQIAVSIDRGYLPHCATMLESLAESNRESEFHVHLLHRGMQSADLESLRADLIRNGIQLSDYEIPASLINEFPRDKFHESCWYRALLPEVIPDLDKVLYLDSDMVVVDDIRPLWSSAVGHSGFAAVVNPLYPFMPDRISEDLGLQHAGDYLNSGVLLLDLKRMREVDFVARVRRYATAHPDNIWPEQDAMSVVFQGEWLQLHPRWNLQTTLLDLTPSSLPFPVEVVVEAVSSPAIVHFIGPNKPWHYQCTHPYQGRYLACRSKTAWSEFTLEGRSFRGWVMRKLSLSHQVALQQVVGGIKRRVKQWLPF